MANGDFFGNITDSLFQGYLRNKQLDLQRDNLNLRKESIDNTNLYREKTMEADEKNKRQQEFITLLNALSGEARDMVILQHPFLKNNPQIQKTIKEEIAIKDDINSLISNLYSMRSNESLIESRKLLANPGYNKYFTPKQREELNKLISTNEEKLEITLQEFQNSSEGLAFARSNAEYEAFKDSQRISSTEANRKLQEYNPGVTITRKNKEAIRQSTLKRLETRRNDLYSEGIQSLQRGIGTFPGDEPVKQKDSDASTSGPIGLPKIPSAYKKTLGLSGILDNQLASNEDASNVLKDMFDFDDNRIEPEPKIEPVSGALPREVRELMNKGLSLQDASREAQAMKTRASEARSNLGQNVGKVFRAITEDLPDALGAQEARKFLENIPAGSNPQTFFNPSGR